jgi:hypothetical protein
MARPWGRFTKIPFAIRKKMDTIWRKEHPGVSGHIQPSEYGGYYSPRSGDVFSFASAKCGSEYDDPQN